MRLLLDECLPLDLRLRFPAHDAHTVDWAGFKGLRNGDLLRAAEDEGYEVLLTVDQGIRYEQHARTCKIYINHHSLPDESARRLGGSDSAHLASA